MHNAVEQAAIAEEFAGLETFRQFLLRGFEKVQGEWSLVCTTHNILKLYRLCV